MIRFLVGDRKKYFWGELHNGSVSLVDFIHIWCVVLAGYLL